MDYIFLSAPSSIMIGLTVIRIGIGVLFIGHGSLKIMHGISQLKWTGEQMKNVGIVFAPLFWGICAMLSEFGGGICLTLGLFTRIAAAFMAFTMFVAVMHHIKKGDSYRYVSFPFSQMVVFIGLLIAGGGIYSLDYYVWGYIQ